MWTFRMSLAMDKMEMMQLFEYLFSLIYWMTFLIMCMREEYQNYHKKHNNWNTERMKTYTWFSFRV